MDGQNQLGAFFSDWIGLWGQEAIKVEAACASGAAALRAALMAVASGDIDSALIVGVEKMTDKAGLPGQIARGILLGIALYPFRARFLELGYKGGLAIASLYLLIGQFACPGTSPGSIEGFVYTRLPLDFQFAVMPEIIGQGLALGYLIYLWERRTSRPRTEAA